jgi:hypothetical protein
MHVRESVYVFILINHAHVYYTTHYITPHNAIHYRPGFPYAETQSCGSCNKYRNSFDDAMLSKEWKKSLRDARSINQMHISIATGM